MTYPASFAGLVRWLVVISDSRAAARRGNPRGWDAGYVGMTKREEVQKKLEAIPTKFAGTSPSAGSRSVKWLSAGKKI